MKECKHFDKEFNCCKVLSDWSDPMPVLQPCIESPCEYYKITLPNGSEPSTKLEDVYSEIKKHFNYKETDPTVYTSKTLSEQFNDYLKSLEQDTAKRIFDNLEKFGVYDNGMYHFIIGAYAYQTIRKKYTGEPNQ